MPDTSHTATPSPVLYRIFHAGFAMIGELRSDGDIYRFTASLAGDGAIWERAGRIKAGVEPQDWLATQIDRGWQIIDSDVPSGAKLSVWASTGAARSLDGCIVEADGHCPHGKPSWLVALRML